MFRPTPRPDLGGSKGGGRWGAEGWEAPEGARRVGCLNISRFFFRLLPQFSFFLPYSWTCCHGSRPIVRVRASGVISCERRQDSLPLHCWERFDLPCETTFASPFKCVHRSVPYRQHLGATGFCRFEPFHDYPLQSNAERRRYRQKLPIRPEYAHLRQPN